MGIDKIINELELIFKKDKIKKTHCEALADLLKELEKKENKIKVELSAESSKKKRKKLKIELKIVQVQLRKGSSKLNALKKCR